MNIDNIFAKYDCIVVTTLVHCLSRKNHLYHAYDIVIDYESKTEDVYYAMWLAVLSGCRKYENKLLAERIYKDMRNRFNAKDNCMTHATVLLSHLRLLPNL